MPAILIRILTWMMTSIAGQVLFSLGLGVVSFTTINSLLQWITERVTTGFYASPPSVIIFIKLFSIDYYVSVMISALIIKATIMSAQVALSKRA